MSTSDTMTYETVLRTVRDWTPAQRLALMHDVLRTLQPDLSKQRPRRATLAAALGMLANDRPPPSDDEVAQWLDEHRLEKYG